MTKDILEVVQCLPSDVQINVKEFLPSNVTVNNTVSRLARRFSSEIANEATHIMAIRGAIKTDGMTFSSTGDKYNDFNVHYFKLSLTSFATSPTT